MLPNEFGLAILSHLPEDPAPPLQGTSPYVVVLHELLSKARRKHGYNLVVYTSISNPFEWAAWRYCFWADITCRILIPYPEFHDKLKLYPRMMEALERATLWNKVWEFRGPMFVRPQEDEYKSLDGLGNLIVQHCNALAVYTKTDPLKGKSDVHRAAYLASQNSIPVVDLRPKLKEYYG